MRDEDVNKIIAEYMGYDDAKLRSDDNDDYHSMAFYKDDKVVAYVSWWYTESLDALIPVWEKLYPNNFTLTMFMRRGNDFKFLFEIPHHQKHAYGQTIQQAAAHATAKAIIELRDGND